jgi:hypothetical protein
MGCASSWLCSGGYGVNLDDDAEPRAFREQLVALGGLLFR